MNRNYEDVPDFETPIAVTLTDRCASCGKRSRPPHETVARFPHPEEPDDDRRRCTDCYVSILTEISELDRLPAAVLALEAAGYDHDSISHGLGHAYTRIMREAKRAREQARGSPAERLLEYL